MHYIRYSPGGAILCACQTHCHSPEGEAEGGIFNLYITKHDSPLGYESVYLALPKVADTLFHIQGEGLYIDR